MTSELNDVAGADPDASQFGTAALQGLAAPQKTLPCQYLYDERGSVLFEKITDVPEYYPTRTEIGILGDFVDEIVAQTPAGAVLVEFGSGSSRKTEILLAAFDKLAAYAPLDVSASALDDARGRLAERFPALRVHPVVGDFRADLVLPPDLASRPRIGFFPGSTIGNFQPHEAIELLGGMRDTLGRAPASSSASTCARTSARCCRPTTMRPASLPPST